MKHILLFAWFTLTPVAFLYAAEPATKPNILIILSDDHSAPHLGCYGDTNLKTPRLDQLASQGMRFERAYTTAPQCVPSRASILTGRSPVGINMSRFSAPLPADVVALPDLLRAQGYFTGLLGRTYHLDGSPVPGLLAEAYKREKLSTMESRVDMAGRDSDRSKAPGYLNEFLDAAKGKPFFLQFCFSDPHRTHDAGENRPPETLKLPGHFSDLPAVRADLARYYGEVERVDGSVGQLLDILDERGLSKNTIVVFMGDNGCSQLRGKGTLYEFGLHVPLLVRWPGMAKPGSTSETLVSGEDITPTLLTAAGIEPPKSMTGVSFLGALRGDAKFAGRAEVFGERGAHGSGLPRSTGAFDLSRCIITPTHKLIYNALPTLVYSPVDFANLPGWTDVVKANDEGKLPAELSKVYFPKQRPMFELYDLTKDPAELHNLVGTTENASLEEDLKERLAVWMLHERDFLPLPVTKKEGAPAKDKKARKT